MTPAEIEAEYWAYHYSESNDKESFEDDDFDKYTDEQIDDIASIDDWENMVNESENYD